MKAERETLDGLLQQTDKEILGNWAKLAKVIKEYEHIPWNKAGEKARKIIGSPKGLVYLNKVRNPKAEAKVSVKKNKTKLKEKKVTPQPKSTKRDRFSQNYKRLMQIAPDLEEMLLEGKEPYGKSVSPGYMDLNFDFNLKDSANKFIAALSHYYKQNGDMIADPDMVLLIDTDQQTVQALTFQDMYGYAQVYADIYVRRRVDLHQKKSQNAFLEKWLLNLINQNHSIVWDEEEAEDTIEEVEIEAIEIQESIKEKVEEPKFVLLPDFKQKLIRFIATHENISEEKVKKKVDQFKDRKTLEEYVIKTIENSQVEDLKLEKELEQGFDLLTKIFPKLENRLKKKDFSGYLLSEKQKDDFQNYSYSMQTDSRIDRKYVIEISGIEKNPKVDLYIDLKKKQVEVKSMTEVDETANYTFTEKTTLKEKIEVASRLNVILETFVAAKVYQVDEFPKVKEKEQKKEEVSPNTKQLLADLLEKDQKHLSKPKATEKKLEDEGLKSLFARQSGSYQSLIKLLPQLSNIKSGKPLLGFLISAKGVMTTRFAFVAYLLQSDPQKVFTTLSFLEGDESPNIAFTVDLITNKVLLKYVTKNNSFIDEITQKDLENVDQAQQIELSDQLSSFLSLLVDHKYTFYEKDNLPEPPKEVEKKEYPITIFWAEGSEDENIGLNSLEELQERLKKYEVIMKPSSGYTKVKVGFKGLEYAVRIDLSVTKGDYNPHNQNIRDWLNDYDSNFDWSQFEKQEEKQVKKRKKTPKVPDFEVGKVKLVEAHTKVGLTQKDINWINKNKQGMVLTPRKKSPINNTQDLLADLSKQAKKPGFRISATGKLYYEGRSNRSDLTDGGL